MWRGRTDDSVWQIVVNSTRRVVNPAIFTHFGIALPPSGNYLPKWVNMGSSLGGGGVEPGATLERQRRRHDRLILITGRRLHIATVIGARTEGENYRNQHEGEQSMCHCSQLYGG